MAWDENHVRGQDYFTCLQYISHNRVGQSLVWNYVRENWIKIANRFGIDDRYLGRLIASITSRFTTNTQLEEMQAFFNKYPEAGAGAASRKEAIETVRNNVKWLEQNFQSVSDWLENNKQLSNTQQTIKTEMIKNENQTKVMATTVSSELDSKETTKLVDIPATTPVQNN